MNTCAYAGLMLMCLSLLSLQGMDGLDGMPNVEPDQEDWIKLAQTGPVIFPGMPPCGMVNLEWSDANPQVPPMAVNPKPPGLMSNPMLGQGQRGGRPGRKGHPARSKPPPMKGPFKTEGGFEIPPNDNQVNDESSIVPGQRPKSRGRPRSGEGPSASGGYICQICGREFATWAGRYFHMAKHTGKYKVTCELCDKGFMKMDAYKNHMQMHRKQIQSR